MSDWTKERAAEVRARRKGATGGRWEITRHGERILEFGHDVSDGDMVFFAWSRNDMDAALDRIEELEKAGAEKDARIAELEADNGPLGGFLRGMHKTMDDLGCSGMATTPLPDRIVFIIEDRDKARADIALMRPVVAAAPALADMAMLYTLDVELPKPFKDALNVMYHATTAYEAAIADRDAKEADDE